MNVSLPHLKSVAFTSFTQGRREGGQGRHFGAFMSFMARNFPEGVIVDLVPKMLERSSVNFNSRPISDSGKTVS